MTDDIDLHDATLLAIRVSWADGTCVAEIAHSKMGTCTLMFSGLSHLILPRKHDWGCSVSINSFSRPGNGQYEIEMQSGDVIKIEAIAAALDTSRRD
jgi:hypothetical protein